jgi:hypothetical protein
LRSKSPEQDRQQEEHPLAANGLGHWDERVEYAEQVEGHGKERVAGHAPSACCLLRLLSPQLSSACGRAFPAYSSKIQDVIVEIVVGRNTANFQYRSIYRKRLRIASCCMETAKIQCESEAKLYVCIWISPYAQPDPVFFLRFLIKPVGNKF